MTRLAFVAVAAVLVGCHAGNSPPGMDVDASGSGGSGGSGDGALPAQFEELISRTFTANPGQDYYQCIRIQVPQEMWINAFEPLPTAKGTHHQILTLTTGTPATTGPYDCDDEIGANDMQMLYASGLETTGMQLPDGYAVHLPAGAYINLVVHVFNSGDAPITDGKAGVMVKQLAVTSTPPKEVDFMFNGTRNFTVSGTGTSIQAGSCTVPTDWTIFALWPHMHSRGKHVRFFVEHASSQRDVILDTDYDYTSEQFYPMAQPMDVVAGGAPDKLFTECTWTSTTTNNPSGQALHYGASAADEMCFTGFYKYPAGGFDKYYCAP